MPCTVTPDDIAYYERAYNEKEYGIAGGNLAITTAVACYLVREAEQGSDPKKRPLWVAKWIKNHAKEDSLRKEQIEARDRTQGYSDAELVMPKKR